MRRRRELYHFGLTALLSLALLLSCARSQSQVGGSFLPLTENKNVSESDGFSLVSQIAPDDCIYIQARINKSEPMWFILDTGADRLIINSKLASSLGLKSEGNTDIRGAGEKIVAAYRVKDISFEFAGTSIPLHTATVVALDDLEQHAGREIAGIIGYPLFKRFVIEIDFASRKITAYDPNHFRYEGQGEILPLLIENGHPHVIAHISLPERKSLEAKFVVDTGAPSVAAVFTRPFVESHQLLRAGYKSILFPGGRGIGGEINLRVGRAGTLELGRFVLRSPVVGFFQDREGFGASLEVDGLIGDEILGRFKVIFDYPHERIILEPNAQLTEPFEANMSGFRMRAGGEDFKTFTAHSVLESSPASEAGILDRDKITTINGQPARNFTLPQLYRMFKQEGREVLLGLRRGRESRQVKLRLRRLV